MRTSFLLLLLFPLATRAQSPTVYLLPATRLQALQQAARSGNSSVKPAIDSLRKTADGLLSQRPYSVMNKTILPVSGNKHDYMSQAPYFWYDSSKPNGRPYLRRDGEHNPEIKKITDRTEIGALESSTRTLALAWYLTGDETYAAKASQLIRTWFLDTATRMNPHLEYAQGIPGINDGRGIGIIESRTLMGIADAAGLLAGSRYWTTENSTALQEWYRQFLHWMLTSKNGKEEMAARNNHGSWYYAQVIDFALFTGNKALARQLVAESKRLLNSQLTREGKWPLELERTNALGYSTFNTAAWFTVATLATQAGEDLWNYKTSTGATLRTALDWLRPYALGEQSWTFQQIGPYNRNEYYALLRQAAVVYPGKGYQKLVPTTTTKSPITLLLY